MSHPTPHATTAALNADAPALQPLPRLGLWTLLGLIGFVAAAGLSPMLWATTSGFVPAWNVAAPASIANIATAPDVWRGMGLGALLPAQPLLLLGIEPAAAVQWVLLATLALGAVAVYVWLAPQFGDRGAALGAIVWLLLPMHLATVFVQGAPAILIVLALLPLVLAGLRAFARQGSLLGAVVAVVALLWMWRAQAGLALAATLLVAAYAALVLRHRLALLAALGSGVAGLLSLAALLGLRAAPPSPFDESFVTLYGLLRHNAAPGEPLQMGIAAFMLALLGLFALYTGDRLAGPEERRLLAFAAATIVLLIALALPWAAALWRITRAELLFTYAWQPLLLAGPLFAALAAAVPALFADWRRSSLWAAAVLAVAIAAQPALTPTWSSATSPAQPLAIVDDNVLALLEATVTESPAREGADPTATLTLGWQVLRTPTFDDNLFFQALAESGMSDGGEPLAQLDVQPLAELPATQWAPGALYTRSYTLTLPAEAVADLLAQGGEVVYHAGFYDWRDGTRRSISAGAQVAPLGAENKLVLPGQAADGD